MLPTRQRKTKSLIAKAAELAVAVPQVVAHRVTRMALAGPSLSERDRKEFELMGSEKAAAFMASMNAMSAHAVGANQAFAASLLQSLWSPSPRSGQSLSTAAARLHRAALGMFNEGMDPVHRKAVANAKRLARTRLR